MGTKGKNRTGERSYESLGGKRKIEVLRWKDKCTTRLYRPLRIFQFLTILLLFAMIVHMIAIPVRLLSDWASILMVILTCSYLFFMAIDMISQLGSHGLPDTPMFVLSFLGIILYATAGGLLIYHRAVSNNFWALVVARTMCFVVGGLYLIEITMLLACWRQKCANWRKCYPYTPTGTCAQRDMMKLFSRNDPHDHDLECGRRDLTTSISQFCIPLETGMENAVMQHGRRKVTVGHRRQYVDCQSSVPALSIVQIAQIQTENGPTVSSGCQTQRTETKEILVQTTSRCELCHRQMNEGPISPTKSSASPSMESQSPFPSPLRTQIPSLVPENTTQYSFPQTPISSEPQSQRGNCAICPAMFHLVRGGITSPCCQSCNCAATGQTHQPSNLHVLDRKPQEPEILSSDWTEQDVSHTPRSIKPMESESQSTMAEKSDAERGDLVIEEGNKLRPSKKLERVYETRPCPTHGAGLAARMAGLPESVTKVTLSSISVKRNKRTQTPNKKNDSSSSRDIEEKRGGDKILHSSYNNRRKEDTTNGEKNQDKSRDNKNKKILMDFTSEKFEKIDGVSKIEENIEKLSDERVKKISSVEMARRLSEERKNSFRSPKKLYRDNDVRIKTIEPIFSSEIVKVNDRDSKSVKSRSMKEGSSGQMLWKSESTNIRESDLLEKIDNSSGEEIQMKENSDGEIDVERKRNKLTFEKSMNKNDPGTSVESRERQIDGNVSMIGSKKSSIGSGPILRLRMEKPVEDLIIMDDETEQSDEVFSKSENLEFRSSMGSRTKRSVGESFKKNSEIRSKNSEDEMTLRRSKDDSSKIIKSPESKRSLVFHERSSKIKRAISHSHSERLDEEGRFIDEETPERLEEEIREYETWERDRENSGEGNDERSNSGIRKTFSTSRRVTGTKSVVRDDEGSKILRGRSKTDPSEILQPSESKKSRVFRERSAKIGKAFYESPSDYIDEEGISVGEQTPLIFNEDEINECSSESGISGKNDESDRDKQRKKSSIGSEKKMSAASRLWRTKSTVRDDEGNKNWMAGSMSDLSKIERASYRSRSDYPDEGTKLIEDEMPMKLRAGENSDYEISGRDDDDEMEEKFKKSTSGVEKKTLRSNRVSRTRSIYRNDDEDSKILMKKHKSDGSKIIRSPESKKSFMSQGGGSVKIERISESHSNRTDEETPTRLKEEEMREYEISDRDEESDVEEKIEKSSFHVRKESSRSSRVSRTKSIVRADEGSKNFLRPRSDGSKIIQSPGSKKSLISQKGSVKMERGISESRSNRPGEETPVRLNEEEIYERDYEIDEKIKKSSSGVQKEFSRSSRVSETRKIVRGDESKKISTGRPKSDVSKISQSSGSKINFISEKKSSKIENEKSQSHSNWPREHKESIDEEKPTKLTEEEKSEHETAQRDEDEIVKKSRSSVPKEFARSDKISRTKPSVDGNNESKERMIDEKNSSMRKSTRTNSQEVEKGRSSIVSWPRSRRDTTNVILSPKRETRREGLNSGEFAYRQASWSPNVFQRTSRVESTERRERSQMSCDPNIEVESGRPDRPSGLCMENSACQQPSGFYAIEYPSSVPPICTDATVCVEPCSCRVKSALVQQRSPNRQCARYNNPERASIESRNLSYENETSNRQYPNAQLCCPQGTSSWDCPRQQQKPGCYYTTMRSTDNYENTTRPRRSSNNFCFVS